MAFAATVIAVADGELQQCNVGLAAVGVRRGAWEQTQAKLPVTPWQWHACEIIGGETADMAR
jgi:hypothetical protein